jgi:hypothetical protein
VYFWRYLAAAATAETSDGFATREAAEAWLAANWENLAGREIEEVVLTDAASGEVLYRMSLAAGEPAGGATSG